MATFEELSSSLPSEADQQRWNKLLELGDLLPNEGQEAEGSFFPEAERALTGGAIGAVGSALTGEAARAAAIRRERIQMGVVQDVMKELGLESGVRFTPEQQKKFAARVSEEMAAIPVEDFAQSKTYDLGESIKKYAAKNYGPAKDYEDSITTKFFGALGSSVPMLGGAIVNPALGFEMGVGMSAGEAVDRAIAAGASKEDVLRAANLSFVGGATEMAPVEVLFNKLPLPAWGKMATALAKWGAVALAEGGQELFQQFWQNLVAKWEYKPDQDLSQGVAEAGLLGLAVGGVFGAAGIPGQLAEEPAPPPPPGALPPGAEPAATVIPPEEPPGGPPALPTPVPEPAIVAPTPALPVTPEQAAVEAEIDTQFAREMEVPDSPRLTELDRKSPIPNEIIDTGKAAVEAATGQPSTFTTTQEVNGKREVVTGKVSDLVSQNRAETAAITSQIMEGVSTPEILAGRAVAAPPVSAAEVPAPTVPTGVPATPAPSIGRRLPGRTLDEGMQKLKARAAAYDAEVADLASSGTSIKMVSNRDPTRRALIGPDMSEPGKFRVTYMDAQGPSGHTVHNTMQDAAGQVIGSYHPVGNIPRLAVKKDVAVTPGGREVPVVYALVEADDLVTSQRDEGGANPAYPQELQPRDRSRGTSDVQINNIAQNLNPRLLDNNVSASDGAPIVSADGVVESGNGRVLGIRRAYNEGLPGAEAYRQYLDEQGYIALTGAEDMRKPVLVRVRQGQLEQGERTAFTREANERTTMELSEPEQAMADAAAMPEATVGLYRGGEIEEAGNRDFVRSFAQSVVSPNEQGGMVTPDGTLSQKAIRRIRAALLARAFGDTELVSTLVESLDNNIKAIGGALMDVAGLWAQMRTEAATGKINPGAEITANLLEAVRLVQRARNEGRPLAEFVGQKDIFTGATISPETEAVLRLMFRNTASWTMPAGREKLAEALRFYATEARKTSAGVDLLGEKAPAASRILEEAKKRQYGQEETQAKLPSGDRVAGKDTGAPSGGRAVEAQPRAQAEGRPSPAPKAPAPEVEPSVAAAAEWLAAGKADQSRAAVPQVRERFSLSAMQAVEAIRQAAVIRSAPVTTPDVELSIDEAIQQVIREDGERRAREAKEKADAKAGTGLIPKFLRALSKIEPVAPPIPRKIKNKLFRSIWLHKDKAGNYDMRAAEAKMQTITPTDEKPFLDADGTQTNEDTGTKNPKYVGTYKEVFGDFGTDQWWDSRLYRIKQSGKTVQVHLKEALDYLRTVAETLAVTELNESREKANKDAGKKIWEAVPLYTVAKEKIAVLIMGYPGAGKSTIANPIAERLKAAISDVDEAKKLIPEYYDPDDGKGGVGAGAVHVESSEMGYDVTMELIADGANIVIPTVGDQHKKIESLRQKLAENGYTVHLVQMKVSPIDAVRRMIGRFVATGRLIPKDYFLSVMGKPPYMFEFAKQEGKFDGYYTVRSDNRFDARVTEATGAAPILAGGEEFDRAGAIRAPRDIADRGNGQRPQAPPGEPRFEVGPPATAPPTGPTPAAPFAPRTQERRTQVGTLGYVTKDSFAPKAAAFLKSFRKILDDYGLKGIDLDVWEDILLDGKEPIEGLYLPNLIEVAASRGDPNVTVHHEVIHALFNLALGDREKAVLLHKSRRDWVTPQIKHDYSEFDTRTQAEEGIAHAYTDWLAGQKFDGIIVKSFRKIQTYLKSLYQALTGHDIRSAEDIFRQIQSGKIGRRTQAGARTEITAVTPLFTKAGAAKARIGAAIDEVYSTLFPNPLNDAEVGFANKEQTAVVMMQLENYGDSLYVKWLTAYPQKSGMGTEGMNVLKDIARKHDVPLTLTPWARGELGTKKLTGIFKKWGFVPGKGGLLWWHPEGKAEAAPKFSKPTTEIVDMFEGPREQFVIPGAERVSEATLAQRRAEAPMRTTVGQRGTEGLPLFGDEQNQLALFKKAPSGPADPRFKLKSAPHTAGQAQQVSQGFLNRGQPVDRAIRVPFNLLGGLDEQNRWRPGKRLSDKMGSAGRQGLGIGGMIGAGIGTVAAGPVGGAVGFFAGGTVGAFILGSSPSPTGKFAWFHGIAENAKRGLIDGYGLDPAYIEAYRQSELGKTAILREAQGILKVLSNAGVGTQEAKVLQAVLTGENVTDADMIKLSVPIRKAIDDLGAEAVSLGLISAESFERNRGAYLHRIYAKNEVDQSNLAGWVSARMAGRRKKILGDQLKGRGMFMDVEAERMMRDVESFKQGARGAPVQGEKFRVIDEVSSVADLTGGAPKEKTLRRVYLPAGEAVPAKYQGASWVDRGQWEVRKAGKKPTLWRDYTKAEREKMGELVDARYTIAKTFMLMANDLSTGRFFKDVSEKAEWTVSKPPPDGQWKDASEYSRYWEDPEIRWVKVPDTNIEKTGGKKRWGALAGKWVRSEIWRDLNEVDIANRPGTWRVLLTQWKKNKTARNPVVHMNNVISNVMFMDLADVRTQDLIGGIDAYVRGTADFREALENGAFGGDMVSAEIRDEVLKPLLEQIGKQQTGAGNPFLKRAGMLGVVADKLWTWAKTADNGLLRAYQAEDQLFRMAAYMRRRSQGESPRVAAMNARDQFLNYDIRAPWVVMARNSLFPFISYTYRAVPKLAENIMHRPWKVAKYAAIAYAVNALAYLWDEGDDDEDRERAALRDEEQGYSWLGTPRMIRMPWRDKNGLPVFLDVRRWIPAGDIFDTTQGSSALPIPGPLHFGGPLQMAFEFMLNKQAFTGEEITNELTMNNADKFSSVADWAWKSWAPASFWMPNSWYWTKIANAVYGATDTAGHPYSVPQAFLSSVGVKVKPVDVDDGIKWHYFDFRKVQNALKDDMRSLVHRLERGLISQEAFDRGAARIMEKYENLGQRIGEFNTRIEKPKKAGG